ncbi:YnfA family protein [Pusillimonas sp. DMV24BSW_D]|uniref:YnfA family protein n=1 Tax=Neopusillimonas aestuarii TaxID=2716226 RepID=UPI00140726ED|nr:YnfA family protein [Pusillimonas sp. DMV24BSW_D]QIM49773.1 YnfA family protein [Pusillimonas sp. DMV24BSW_D]
MLKTTGLFIVTALAEIIGCYLPYLWLKKSGPIWLLIPAAISLAFFAWLLTLHPAASGRIYAAYGGVYVATALVWLRVVDGVPLTTTDWVGATVALAGMGIMVSGWEG